MAEHDYSLLEQSSTVSLWEQNLPMWDESRLLQYAITYSNSYNNFADWFFKADAMKVNTLPQQTPLQLLDIYRMFTVGQKH